MPLLPALSELVAFPTVSDQPVTAIAAWLAERAEAAGMRVERFETSPGKCNVVASAGPAGTDGLLLSGHMDVVPVTGQSWTSDPFRLTERDGKVYARGACDMKGFLACVTVALERLSLGRLQRELVLAWTHDEEVGCHGSRALADRMVAEGRQLPGLAVIGEPTDFRICRAHPGHTTLRIHCQGVPAHSSRPQLGASAITMAGQVLAALERLQASFAREPALGVDPLILAALPSPWPVLNCGHVHGGTAVNIVAEHCELLVGVRQLPGQSGRALFRRIEEACAEVALAWAPRGGSITCSLLHEAPALLTPEGSPLEALLRPHASAPQAGVVPYATDGGNLERAGVQSLVFGPGSIDVAHKADEHVAIADLHRCVDVVGRLVLDRCGAVPL